MCLLGNLDQLEAHRKCLYEPSDLEVEHRKHLGGPEDLRKGIPEVSDLPGRPPHGEPEVALASPDDPPPPGSVFRNSSETLPVPYAGPEVTSQVGVTNRKCLVEVAKPAQRHTGSQCNVSLLRQHFLRYQYWHKGS